MKISLIMNIRMPTEKAHGYQIVKMCEALASHGATVSLVVPTRGTKNNSDIFSYYSLRKNFSIRYVPAFDALAFFRYSWFAFYAQAVSFLIALRNEAIDLDTIIITRSPEVAWWYGRKGYRVFYDAHNFPLRGVTFLQYLLRGVAGVVTNSNGTADAFRHAGFTNVISVPNGVDLEQFTDSPQKTRTELGLPDGYIAMYVGHLYGWKGVDVVVEAARRSKIENLTFVFVGGTEVDLARYRAETKNIDNVVFLGHRPRHEIPQYIKNANVLLLPNVPVSLESQLYTSPIKMFEYMASGVPIVASDLPSIREVLNSTNAVLVEPQNPDALLSGVGEAFGSDTKSITEQARRDVEQYTWNSRAVKVLDFVGSA